MVSIKKVKQKAWEFYDAWRKTETYSPAFKSDIRISRMGWRHITGEAGRRRTFADIHRRLKLLPYAKQIIESSTTVQNVVTKRGKTFYALEAMVEVEEDEGKDLRKVRVVLVEDKQGNKVFYSVMDKKSGAPHALVVRRQRRKE